MLPINSRCRVFAHVLCVVFSALYFPWAVLCAQVAQATISNQNASISAAVVYDGEGFVATTPNSGALHRNALVVQGGGTLTLTSGADVWIKNDDNHTTFLRVGYYNSDTLLGGVGTLNVSAGATLRIGQASRYANFHVGEGVGNTGTFTESGGDVTVKGSFNVGVDGGTGTATINGGTFTLDHDDNAANHTTLATIGLNLNLAGPNAGTSNGTLVINGGTMNLLAHEWDSTGHPGSYGSVALILGNRDRGAASYGEGNGTLTQNGGVLHIDNHTGLYLSSVGNGVYNLNGGILEIGGTSLQAKYGNGAGTYAFNFGGGTIKVLDSDLLASVNVRLVSGATSVINTNGLNAKLSGNLTAAGLHQIDFGGNALVKTGLGLLTFSGSNRVFDTFVVTGGSARQTAGATSAVEFMVGSGSGNTGAYLMDGGTLTITPSTRSDGTTVVAGSFRVGDFSGAGTFTQTAGTVTVQDNGGFNIGNQGGTGVYNLTGGTLNLNAGLHILGRSDAGKPQSKGTLNLSGGTLNVQNTGSLIIGNNLVNGLTTSSGLINQTGGVLHVDGASSLWLTGVGPGIYRLSGGTLEIGGTSLRSDYPSGISAVPNFYFGGGTIKVTGSDLNTAVNAQLVSGAASTINTNGLNATLTGNLMAAGLHQIDFGGNALVKSGLGTLTMSGTSRVLDTFAVTAGAVRQTAGATSAVEFMTGTGNGNTASYLMDGGSLTVTPSTLADNTTAVAASMRVGDFGGTGTFTQTAGTVTLADNGALNIGNQGGAGTYNLSGGTLVLNRGTHVLGRSTAGNPVSQGTLNISGGTLLLQNGGSLLNGNNQPGGAAGTGTITQTGGVLHVDNSSRFYLSGYSTAGAGIYNLNGGTLEIGGTSLLARYNNSVSSYTFNFGGGTIKVIDTDLTSAVKTTLTMGTASTLNTNGLAAVWSGDFTGTGALFKVGLGALTLSGANNFGALVAQAGSTTNGSGVTTVGILGVGADGASGAVFNLSAGVVNVKQTDPARGELTVGGGVGGSGTLNVNGGVLNVGDVTSFGRFFVGAYDGTGAVNQSGGTVNVSGPFNIGNRGGNGTYALTGGLLNVGQFPAAGDSNALILGRSRTGQQSGVSKGYLNIGGTGTLVLNTNTPLLIGGDSGSTAALSQGYVTQSGGTVTVQSWIDLGSRGHGEYRLNGGTLEIGGSSSLISTSGDYAFTLGGGTIKVTGSAFSTGLAATLANSTTSTINTNGFEATFSGSLSGQGGLVKTGAGTLLFTGTSNYSGVTTVSVGTLRVDGALAASRVNVGNGATLSGHGAVFDVNILSGGSLGLGAAVGGFTINHDLTLLGGSYTLMRITSLDSYDQLTIGNTFTAGGTLAVTLTGGFTPLTGASFTLFDAGTTTGNFSSVLLPALTSGLAWNTNQLYANGVISVQTSAIPEPSTWAVILGGVALVAGGWRRIKLRRCGVE